MLYLNGTMINKRRCGVYGNRKLGVQEVVYLRFNKLEGGAVFW